jgi:hypothetical protein
VHNSIGQHKASLERYISDTKKHSDGSMAKMHLEDNVKKFLLVIIEESKTDPALLVNSYPGMLLPPFGDLSHTSILYYHNILQHQNI